MIVVDDEKDFCFFVKKNLEGTDRYDVLTLSNARNVIFQINRFKPDVILLDMLMPGIGGIEVCEMLNDDPFNRSIPIVILSGLDKDCDKLKAYKKGVVDYLIKPIKKEILLTKIEAALKFK